MPYESYKLIHLAAIFVFLSSASVLLLVAQAGKTWKIITGIASLFILIAGVGMLHKQGYGFPVWAQMKLAVWLVVTGMGHVVAKRFPNRGPAAYWTTIFLSIVAAYLAIYKPV